MVVALACLSAVALPATETFALQGGSSSCPSGAHPPKGLLYNHLSKTGGTTMKMLLFTATGASSRADANVTKLKLPEHITGLDSRLGPNGALVIQDDIFHDLAVNAADAESFFVVGVVRRPCDYMLSSWAWMSERNKGKAGDQMHWGVEPPYDNPDDLGRFQAWVDKQIGHRDAGHGYEEGSYFMSSHMAQRYEDTEHVHCWVRTHNMVDDLKKCMKQYEGCGGYYNKDGLSEDTVDDVVARSGASIKHGSYAKCSTFFSNTTQMSAVMKTERSLIAQYKLGGCCSQ